ncbi:MAG: alpha/beta hydrolase [Paracoccaceae bacterium]
MPEFITTRQNRTLAYEKTAGQGPGIVFLSGLKSDMCGTKAVHMHAWAKSQGRAFLRFDYSGHGASSGRFEDGCIGDWAEDAAEVITTLTQGPQVLVGSSMGGWISLILATRLKDKIAGIVGIAAAPDFTENGFWAGFSDAQKAELAAKGQVALPSDYDEPYIITKRLIEDGRNHLVLRQPLNLGFPVRFLQGTADTSVPVSWATDIVDHAVGPDIQLTLVKDADHRFSTPACLAMMEAAALQVLG